MTIPDALTLKKAMKIAVKIERLQQKLHELLGATLELPAATEAITGQLLEAAKAPRRRGRPPGSGRKAREGASSANSPLAGRPRPRSISGPLAPAVVKVHEREESWRWSLRRGRSLRPDRHCSRDGCPGTLFLGRSLVLST